MIVRTVVKNGVLHPLDPLPQEWQEGRTVEIDSWSVEPTEADWDQWMKDMDELSAQLDPEDLRRLDESLAEQKRLSKEYVRRQMGLSP